MMKGRTIKLGEEKRERERELEWDRIIKVLWLLQKEKKKQY